MASNQTHRELRRQLTDLETLMLQRVQQGRLDAQHLRRLADLRAVAAFRLRPVPADPVEHARTGYAFIRPYLERLAAHQPTDSVSITNEEGYTYTFRPRTMLRRVLDHALDHLNQIDQWVAWQATGVAPTPTDGWASSADRLDEDQLPLSDNDLSAWLWRIDITWHMLAERASQLSAAQLAWTPPGDEWNLARVLHHVSGGFYVVWLDDPLPDEPVARYGEASSRLYEAIDRAAAVANDEQKTWLAPEAQLTTPDQIMAMLVDAEKARLEPDTNRARGQQPEADG